MLDQFEIEYTYCDVETDEEAYALCKKLGHTSLPVVFMSDEVHFSGFRPDLLRELK